MDANPRQADHPIDRMFLDRWSPRAFTGESIEPADLMTIFEAARWAPSSYNSQPWRFVYARRNTEAWDRFLDLLIPANRSWVIALVVKHHPHRTLANLRRKLVRRLAHTGSTFSGVGASDKPGAVHTLATGLQRLGVRFEVTEAVLNHVSGARSGVAGVYQRHAWTDEKRQALQAWADHVAALSGSKKVPAS